MADKKSLKTALILSILMLMLLVASMVGSTWAWFTDQAVSGRNVIQVGTLDVELEYSRDGETWYNTSSTTRLFDESKSMLPGTYQMVYLRIKNNGSLHLKYKLAMNIREEQGSINMNDENYLLSDYIMVGTISSGDLQNLMTAPNGEALTLEEAMANFTQDPANICEVTETNGKAMSQALNLLRTTEKPDLEEAYLAPQESHVIALIVHTPEELDREINYRSDARPPKIKFGIDVVAGQRSGSEAESDSFGTDYDKDAIYPPFPGTTSTNS